MAFYLSDDLDLIDLDWSEFDDYSEQRHSEESEEEDHILEYTSGTSAAEYRNGKDIQGIHWDYLNFSRDDYRKLRLSGYKNYENIRRSEGEIEKKCQMVESGQTFYDFQFNTRLVKPTIVHFQVLIAYLKIYWNELWVFVFLIHYALAPGE